MDMQREDIRNEARAIKAQFADEFERRFSHMTNREDYFKNVADFTLEKLCLTAARTRLFELELKELKKGLGL